MQSINLNLIPGGVMPVVNVSQYDLKRQFLIKVFDGSDAYTLTGKTVEIRGTKPDGNGFAYGVSDGALSITGNTATVKTLVQMTPLAGDIPCELRITASDGTKLGTLNFIMRVEPSALSDNVPISDTEIPAIERAAAAAVAEAQEAATTATNAASTATQKATAASTSATNANTNALKAEGYAVGKQNGADVASGSPYYHNNSKYFLDETRLSSGTAVEAAEDAQNSKYDAEAYAIGKRDGSDVPSTDPAYHNNAKYYADGAASSAVIAEENAVDAEALANGTRGGSPVPSTDPAYQNNAKYWRDQAASYAAGGLNYMGSVAFANIPTSNMNNGDMYNITDDFTTDSRFIEGAGISAKAGADIAWVQSAGKWDLLSTGGTPEGVLLADGSVAANKLTIGSRIPTETQGVRSFVNGNSCYATADNSHAEGNSTSATGQDSHAEGNLTSASQEAAHAEGVSTQANAKGAHAEGHYTLALTEYQHVCGEYNDYNKLNVLFEVGNGTSNSRSNAFEVYKNGDINYTGDLLHNGSPVSFGNATVSTTDPGAGSTLATGQFYVVYE